MAELIAARNNIFDYPIYGFPYVVRFGMKNISTGKLVTGLATISSYISLNSDTPAPTANSVVEIGQGFYYLLLTSAETRSNLASISIVSGIAGVEDKLIELNIRLSLWKMHDFKILSAVSTAYASDDPILDDFIVTSLFIDLDAIDTFFPTSEYYYDDSLTGSCLAVISGTGSIQFRKIYKWKVNETSGVVTSVRADVFPPLVPLPDINSIIHIYKGLEGELTFFSNVRAIGSVWQETGTINAVLNGQGPYPWDYILTNTITGAPISGADVYMTTDLAGTNTYMQATTNIDGVATFNMKLADIGTTVYIWGCRDGYNMTVDTEVID